MTTQLFGEVFSAVFEKNCLERETGRLQVSKKEVRDIDKVKKVTKTQKVTQEDRLSKKSEVIPN
jgi:hypothetical protein